MAKKRSKQLSPEQIAAGQTYTYTDPPEALSFSTNPVQKQAFIEAFRSNMVHCDGDTPCREWAIQQAYMSVLGMTTSAGFGMGANPMGLREAGFHRAVHIVGEAAKHLDQDPDDGVNYLSPQEANYTPVSPDLDDGKACAACRWFISPDDCNLLSCDVAPTGLCDMYLEVPVEDMNAEQGDGGTCQCDACTADDDDESGVGVAAVWTKKHKDSLPPSSFAVYKNGQGHFPYKDAEGKIDLPHLRNALARLGQSPFGPAAKSKLCAAAYSAGIDSTVCGSTGGKSFGAQIASFFTPKKAEAMQVDSPFLAYKEANGRVRVTMRFSNNFQDRHKEIFPAEAHKDYEAYVDRTGNFPEFWIWHYPVRWGKADFVAYDDAGFQIVSGLAYKGYERLAESMAQLSLGVSHGYVYMSEKAGEINKYRTYEISPLPSEEAANVWCDLLGSAGEKEMALDPKKRAFMVDQLGLPAAFVDGIESSNKEVAAQVIAAGVAHKSVEDGALKEEIVSAVTTILEPVMAQVKSLGASVDELMTAQKSYSESLDDRVERVFGAKVETARNGGGGFVASATKENTEEAAKIAAATGGTVVTDEWASQFAGLVMGGVNHG